MSDFFGLDIGGLISSIGGALQSLAPAPAQGGGFTPASGGGGEFTPAPAVAGPNLWPTVTMPGQGLQPAQLNLGTFQPSGGDYGGFQPSDLGYGGFAPSPGASSSPFQPTPFNPLTFDPNAKPATTPGATGTGTYAGGPVNTAGVAGWIQGKNPNSPIIPIAGEIIAYAQQMGIDPALIFGKLQAESSWATNGRGPTQNNPGNIMAPGADPANGVIILNSYPTMLDGVKAMVNTLASYNRQYGARFGVGQNGKTALSTEDLVAIYYVGPEAYARYGLQANDAGGSGPGGNGTVQDYLDRHIYPTVKEFGQFRQQGPANGNALVQRAQTLIGTPYSLGGLRSHPNNPQAGLDCSEYTAWIYQGQGVNLPWNAQQQYNATGRVGSPNELQVGDLVFFQGTNPQDPDVVTHVGMYIGNGQFINSQDGGVKVANLSDPYWQQHYYGGGRVTTLGG